MDRDLVLGFLNAALSTELHALVRCKRRYYSLNHADGDLRDEFLAQAIEESMSTERLVERIMQLGGLPDFSTQSLAEPGAGEMFTGDLRAAITEDLAAQQRAVESYRDIVRMIGGSDDATCTVLEDIIRRDQQHIERLARHLDRAVPATVGHS